MQDDYLVEKGQYSHRDGLPRDAIPALALILFSWIQLGGIVYVCEAAKLQSDLPS